MCQIIFSIVEVRWSLVREDLCSVNKPCLNFFAFLFSFASEESQEGEKPTKSQILVVLNSFNFKHSESFS